MGLPSPGWAGFACSGVSAPGLRDVASLKRTSFHASSVLEAHSVRVTQFNPSHPRRDVGMPVASPTYMSATLSSSSMRMRASGSGFGSAWPSVAAHAANWRATSQLSGP